MARLAERGRSHESIGSPLGLTRQRVRARDQQVILSRRFAVRGGGCGHPVDLAFGDTFSLRGAYCPKRSEGQG